MNTKKEYKANLTGAWFLFFEIKQVLKLLIAGVSEMEIRKRVFDDNLFQFKYESSIKRAYPSVISRAKHLNLNMQQLLIDGSVDDARLLNLLAIMKDDELFADFMLEIISEKYHSNILHLEKKDINMFFNQKAEQHPKMATWTFNTFQKLRSVYTKILVESGILQDVKSGKLNPIHISSYLYSVLNDSNQDAFVKIFQRERG